MLCCLKTQQKDRSLSRHEYLTVLCIEQKHATVTEVFNLFRLKLQKEIANQRKGEGEEEAELKKSCIVARKSALISIIFRELQTEHPSL